MEWPEAMMDILLTDPPYNVWADVDHDKLSEDDMANFSTLCKKVMKRDW